MQHYYIKFNRGLRHLFVRGCGNFDGKVQNFLSSADSAYFYAFETVYDDGTEEAHYYQHNGLEWVEIDYNIL